MACVASTIYAEGNELASPVSASITSGPTGSLSMRDPDEQLEAADRSAHFGGSILADDHQLTVHELLKSGVPEFAAIA